MSTKTKRKTKTVTKRDVTETRWVVGTWDGTIEMAQELARESKRRIDISCDVDDVYLIPCGDQYLVRKGQRFAMRNGEVWNVDHYEDCMDSGYEGPFDW